MNRTTFERIGAGAVSLVAAASITACGAGAAKRSRPGAKASAAAASTSSAVAATTATGAGTTSAAGGVAPKGTRLSLGSTATVAYKPASDFSDRPATERLRVTVYSMLKGSLADFRGIQLDAAERAGTPFYVKVRITNVGPGDVAPKDDDPSGDFQGIDRTGATQQSVSFIGDFPRCNDGSPPMPMTRGKGYDTCLTFLVPGGITAVAYTGTSDYATSPVTWR
jgi:hypothetical protein